MPGVHAVDSSRSSDASDAGYAMLAMLFVVLILGVLAAVVLGGGYSNPAPVQRPTKATAVSSCLADYRTVLDAVQSYFAANLVDPPAGTTWATAGTKGGPYLTAWPANRHFYSVTWDGSQVGVRPSAGVASLASAGSSSPRTGCYAA